jgi:hypothetical protein
MKKVILFFSVLFLSGMMSYGQLTATLAVPDMGGGLPAGDVFMPITVDAIGGGENFGTFQIFLLYDPLVLTPIDVIYNNPSFPFYEWANNLTYGPNEIVLTWLSFAGGYFPSPGEELCQIQWTYTGDPDYCDVLFNTEGDKIPGWPEKGMTAVWSTWGDIYTLTLDDGSVGPPPVAGYVWNGSADEDWDNPLNWTPNGVPTETDEVSIPDVSKAPFPTIYGSAAAGMLTIFPGAQLNIAPMADLTTFGPFTNNGTFVIESNGIVNPGQGESGSFIDMVGVFGGGVFEFQRDITGVTPFGSQVGWHLISSPLPGGEFISDDLYYYYLNWFDNATQLYVHHAGSPTFPCTPALTLANNLMEGWSIKYDDQYGTLCAGGVEDEVINMIGTSFNSGIQATGFGANWDLLGNPYPNAIDPNFVTWPAGLITNTAYMWDGWSSMNWVPVFSGGPDNIPPTQGFFVEGLPGGGTFQFFGTTGPGGERIHDPFQWWWKGSSDLLALKATVEGLTNSDVTYIRFNEVSTAGLDKEWDANKMYAGIPETPQIYTTTGGLELALNTQPAVELVPMAFICETSGTYTIEAIETGSFTNVVLEDLLTGIQTDLLAGSYTFEHVAGADPDRFFVHFTPLGTPELSANSIDIWSNDHNIYVQAPEINGDIVVFNMMGQEVIRAEIEPGLNIIPVSDVNTYYVVRVVSNDVTRTGKVYVK